MRRVLFEYFEANAHKPLTVEELAALPVSPVAHSRAEPSNMLTQRLSSICGSDASTGHSPVALPTRTLLQ